jgi:hypothetical protein
LRNSMEFEGIVYASIGSIILGRNLICIGKIPAKSLKKRLDKTLFGGSLVETFNLMGV